MPVTQGLAMVQGLLLAGATARTIAEQLHISEHTLRNHLTAIYDKLGVVNRLELFAYAQKHGLDKPAA